MIDKIIDIAKQELDEYGAELVSLLVLEKQAGNSCSKWELMTASKRLKKLASAIDELWSAETLGEIVRIGFNRVDAEDTDGKLYNCYDISGDKVRGEAWDYHEQETKIKWFDLDTPIDNGTIYLDRDEDRYTIINVKILKEQ